MSKFLTGLAMAAAVVAGGLVAAPALADKASQSHPGVLHVFDNANLFSAEGIKKAESAMSATSFDRGLVFTVETFRDVPDDRKAEYEAAKGDPGKKAAFFESWAKSLATGDKAKGPYVLICVNANWTQVIADVESKNRGFSQENTRALHKIFDDAMREGGHKQAEERTAIRDAGLLRGTEYVVNDLKGTKVVNRDGSSPTVAKNPRAGGMSIGG